MSVSHIDTEPGRIDGVNSRSLLWGVQTHVPQHRSTNNLWLDPWWRCNIRFPATDHARERGPKRSTQHFCWHFRGDLWPVGGHRYFFIAAVTRYYEAAPSANVCVFSLFVAGCAGLVWRHYTRNLVRKRQVHFIILGLTISLSYLSTFLLPRDHWLDIFTTAVPILILTNVIGAMILGGLLERHHNQEQRERELLNHAFLDPLTGAMNRRAFEKEYETSILSQTSSCIAFIIIDLDDFKNVNDTYGHTVGDKVLVGVCKILQRSIRDGDLSARFGGDEFVLCLPDISVGDVAPILDRIRRSVSKFGKEEFDLDLNLTVSIGVSWRRKPQRLRAAFESADKSLYQAKANGK
ncbi:MAG: diguanylate cyclase, partial [Roseovarius gahaiensis]